MAIEIVHLATKNGEFQQTMSVYQRVKDRFEELLENFSLGFSKLIHHRFCSVASIDVSPPNPLGPNSDKSPWLSPILFGYGLVNP